VRLCSVPESAAILGKMSFLTRASGASLVLFLLKQLVELLFTASEHQLAEVHFSVFTIVELLEQDATESHVSIEVHSFSSSFHENNLHQFIEKWRCVFKLGEELTRDRIEIALCELVELDSNLSDTLVELVDLAQGLLAEISLSSFVREVEKSHVDWSVSVRRS
jgi:hypothetical protein